MSIQGVKAFRIVAKDSDEFLKTVDFYRQLLGENEKLAFGDSKSAQQAAFFSAGDIDIVITREQITSEANIAQGPAWICFKTENPEKTLSEARNRGADIKNDVVDTSFGTKGFFVNDPAGLALYVGTPWKI